MVTIDGTFTETVHTEQGDIGNSSAADITAVTLIKWLMGKLAQKRSGVVMLYGVGFCSHGQATKQGMCHAAECFDYSMLRGYAGVIQVCKIDSSN